MNKITQRLNYLKKAQKTGLMLHLVAGYPSLEANIAMIKTMDEMGVDFVEIQIPFSDPVADGPTIMRANQSALDAGVSVQDSMHLMVELSRQVDIPLLFMSYYNIVFNYGTERFCLDAKKAGASGLLIPDVPPEEEPYEHLFEHCQQNELINIPFVSPATSPGRLQTIKSLADGFVYCFSTFGITGTDSGLDPRLPEYLASVRKTLDLPLAVGFGIKRRDHIEQIAPHADIAIIGSALIDALERSEKDPTAVVNSFLQAVYPQK